MLIRNANLPDGRSGVDVRVVDGRIAEIGPQLTAAEGTPVFEAQGYLLAHRHSSTRTSTSIRR